ncbi:hypothetical protein E1N52_34775 [Paraburkholderia guartelaensis]|uniref:Uncharacterized protein n=1 Tax=Paraburkholderia guartelaensis TaxID=2546446 RepID=A0A4R5L6W3_9BURK|nr:hypothetical protein [Paraburkholderia guartelaensis]TDG03414.1 hypothetical protein E1N52_34775 [Paraburkholderia guartelaensis]
MSANVAHHARCTIRGAPAIVSFYPDSRIVRISAEDGHCFKQMRWLFGWQALLDVVGDAEEFAHTVPPDASQYEPRVAS